MIFDSIKSFPLYTVMAILIVINYSACQLDDTTPNPTLPHNYPSFESFFIEQERGITVEKFGADDPVDLTSENGTTIQIDAGHLLLSNGSEPTDSISIRLKEFLKKSDLIMADLSLIDDEENVMKVAGLHTVTAKAGSQALGLDGDMIVNFSNAGTDLTDTGELTIYHAENNSSPFLPEASNSTIDLQNNNFSLTTDKLGRFLVAKENPYTSTTTIRLANNLEQDNIIDQRAYLVFKDFKGIKKLSKDGSDFSASGIPVGVAAILVFIAMDDTYFHIATEEITTSENLTVDVFSNNFPPDDFLTLLRKIDDL